MTKNEWIRIADAAVAAGTGNLDHAKRIVASLVRSTKDPRGVRKAAAEIGVSSDLGELQLATGGVERDAPEYALARMLLWACPEVQGLNATIVRAKEICAKAEGR